MKTAVLILLASALPLAAADYLLPRTMKAGQTGELWPGDKPAPLGDGVRYFVRGVGDDWLALRVETGELEGNRMTILVRGVPTADVTDGARWTPAGEWKVEGTEKYKGKTVFVLRPVGKGKK